MSEVGGAATTKLLHASDLDTVKVEKPTVGTFELPQIPADLNTGDVSKQAALVLQAIEQEGSLGSAEQSDKEDEMFLRRRIVLQLEKVSIFLDKILKIYKDGIPTLPEQISVYKSTIRSNMNSLENQEINVRDVIVNIHRIVLPFLRELQMQFVNDQDEEFEFPLVIGEIKECLARLAGMIQSETRRGGLSEQ